MKVFEAPPSRYRVEERDRRLVIVDSAREQRVSDSPGTAARQRIGWRRTSYDGRMTFTTSAWFDDHGPRTVALDAYRARVVRRLFAGLAIAAVALAGLLAAYPAAFLIVIPLLSAKKQREQARARVTRWLDGETPL